ncbi:MarR family transcriptional regulator [Clostridium malenominatum]|uniref:MarR family transcriptional regulator n=1 Tax=Clostridium malenominatum TaxID=1539 RepID=A0ABP3TYT6_9CLOT
MESFKPDSLYHIFAQVIKLHFNRTHQLLEKIGVYPGQPPLLIALHIKDGRSQKELAERLKIKPATINIMVKRMEKANIVRRCQDEEDQRIIRVYLTEEGKKTCREVFEIMKGLESECFSNFTAEEEVLLRRLFMQMKDNLTKVVDKKDGDDCL